MTFRVLIADDDPEIGPYLKAIVEEVADVEVVFIAKNGKEAVQQVVACRPDLVFLDIDMPEMNGIEVARLLRQLRPDLYFVFATVHPEFSLEAYEVYCYDYLLKPLDEKRIVKTVSRIKEQALANRRRGPKEPQSILVQVDDRRIFINPSEILYIECCKPKLLIKTTKGDYLTQCDMATLEQKLDHQLFFRCHKGYLVNLKQIREITPSGRTFEITLHSGDKVMLSRTREKTLREKFGI